jgi:hypothetical protein
LGVLLASFGRPPRELTVSHESISAPRDRLKGVPSDTGPAIEQMLIEGFRAMSASAKLQRVVALNRALVQLATARIRAQYGDDLSERELRLRLAALRLDREVMLRIFGWDPEAEGY